MSREESYLTQTRDLERPPGIWELGQDLNGRGTYQAGAAGKERDRESAVLLRWRRDLSFLLDTSSRLYL